MRCSKFVASAAALSVAAVMSAGSALAAYNTPSKSKMIKTDLVVSYAPCALPNASQFFAGAGIIPACNPPVPTTNADPTNVTTFGPKGAANVQIQVGKGDIKVGIKASDVLNNGLPATLPLGTVADTVVATSGSCAPGLPPQPLPVAGTECTSTDISSLFTAILSVPCTAGKCALKTTINTIVAGAITLGNKANTQIGGVGLSDPDGDPAFVQGLFLP